MTGRRGVVPLVLVLAAGLHCATPAATPPKIVTDGVMFRTAAGAPWRWQLVSMFTAARRFSEGEDLSTQIAWTKHVGANGWRVFLQHAFMDWDPPRGVHEKHWITPLDKVRPLADLLAQHGLYVEFTILADSQAFGEDRGQRYPALNQSFEWQRDRVRDVIAAVTDAPNVFLEIANEPPFNGVDPWKIVDALGLQSKANRPVLMSSGDYRIIGNEQHFRVLDFIGDHPDRDDDYPSDAARTAHLVNEGWPAEAGRSGFPGRRVPVVADEMQKFGETSRDGEDSADPSLDRAEDAGGAFGIGSPGATCHTVDGIRSRVPGPNQTRACTAFFAAMNFFPIEAVTWPYRRNGAAGHPLRPTTSKLAGEVVSRLNGNEAWAAATQTQAGWTAEPAEGWRIVQRAGKRRQFMKLLRTGPVMARNH
ncbi:MAG TPA: hypothetical protein VFV98_03850 [Vicinamibacterales bacterium]|nr:hypothetical protein [Vicinamibacterales bacterium]